MLAVVVLSALADENSHARVRNVVATAQPKSTRSERRRTSSRLTSHLYAHTELRLEFGDQGQSSLIDSALTANFSGYRSSIQMLAADAASVTYRYPAAT
jgi:hypothetical protein